tara:strand:- start:361 stop:573 length:213 start_codon:yes stop_codon:yes gene_type:complete
MNEASREKDRFNALKKKYESEMAIAKAELNTYFESSVGVAEHPHIIESMDLLVTQFANAEEKLKSLEANF